MGESNRPMGKVFFCFIAVVIGCGGGTENQNTEQDANPSDTYSKYDIAVPQDTASSLPKDEYVAGLEKQSMNGQYTMQLKLSDPIPKYTDEYTWTVVLLDMEGNPVSDAQIVAEPTMPDHKHGTFPKYTSGVAQDEPGEYQLADMDLFMPGVWQIDIVISADNTPEDQVLYWFELEG